MSAPRTARRRITTGDRRRTLAVVDTRDFITAGLYDPDAPDAGERLELLEYLCERGATLDEMVAALREGALPAVASDLRRREGGRYLDATEVAAAAGMTVGQVVAIARAAGLPVPEEGIRAYPESTIEAFGAVQVGIEMFGESGVLEFTRAIGAAVASIADAAMAIFGINVSPRLDTLTELERAQTTELASAALVEQVPIAITALFRFHVDAAIRRNIASTSSEGAHVADLAVGFLDLAESTSMVRGLSPSDLAGAIAEFEQKAIELVASREGRVVKTIGDEVMFVTTDASAACDVALELRDMVEKHEVLTALRGGVAAGGLVRGYGDFYGPEVNRAARIVRLADPGTILVTDRVRDLAGADRGYRFEPAGTHELAGFEEPTPVFVLERA